MNTTINGSKQHGAEASSLCFQATWEMDKLARVMAALSEAPDNDEQMHFAYRGICARMLQLTSVLMECLSAEGPIPADTRRIIHFADNGGQA